MERTWQRNTPSGAATRRAHCFDGYPRGEFTLSAANSLEPLNVECGRSSSAVVAMVDHYCTSVWDLRPRHDTPTAGTGAVRSDVSRTLSASTAPSSEATYRPGKVVAADLNLSARVPGPLSA